MTRATSPQTRTSFPIIGLALDSWVTPRRTLASPRLTHLHHHHRITHIHHPSSLRRPLLLVLHQILRTRCSPSLSVLTHSGMRPRSTESSLLRIWRRCVLTCRQFCQLGHHPPAAADYTGPACSALGFPPATTTSTAVIFRGVPLPSMFLFSYQWGHWIFRLGGEYFVRRLCFYVLFIVVLILIVYSIFSLFRILVMFCFFFSICMQL